MAVPDAAPPGSFPPPAPFQRAAAIEALRTQSFDLTVIGGGITGAGVALDAASRGLRVALIDSADFAAGTSSKSSKLIHGGLRYLQQGEVGLVYEALAERQRLLKNAPHLVSLTPFLIPMFGKGGVVPAKIARILGGAMWAYDLTGGLRIGKVHKRVDRDEALTYFPTLPPNNLASAYLYYDCAADDARLVVTVLRTAAHDHRAVVANHLPAVGLRRGESGAIDGVEVRDGDRTFTIDSAAVVNAAGVWSDDVRELDEGAPPDSIRPAKGIHITVPHRLIGNTIAAVIPVPGDRRSVFVVRKGDFAYIGTTDTDFDGSIDDPQCTPDDIAYLLKAINGSCTNEIKAEHILGTWAGLRPLVKSADSGRTADLSRRHKVRVSDAGLVTVTGGKLTTYRKMAADTVDAVLANVLPDELSDGIGKSRTKKLPLRGSSGRKSVTGAARSVTGVDSDTAEHLAGRYGGEARAVMALIGNDPALAEPLVDGLPYVRAEAVFAARFEMARTVDDVLARRTRARLFGRDDSARAAELVGELIAIELGWTPDEAAASAADYRALVEHERDAAGLPEVLLADAVGRAVAVASG